MTYYVIAFIFGALFGWGSLVVYALCSVMGKDEKEGESDGRKTDVCKNDH